jgi:hypothetical protein
VVLQDESHTQCTPNEQPPTLYRLQDRLAELALNLLTLLIRARLAVEGHQRTEIELGLLEQLNLADVNLLCVSLFPHITLATTRSRK